MKIEKIELFARNLTEVARLDEVLWKDRDLIKHYREVGPLLVEMRALLDEAYDLFHDFLMGVQHTEKLLEDEEIRESYKRIHDAFYPPEVIRGVVVKE